MLGSCEKSPRILTGIDPAFLIQLSDLRPVLGKLRSANPGTATKSHSAPLAACTVKIWTASLRTSTSAGFNPPSASSAIFNHCRNPVKVPPFF